MKKQYESTSKYDTYAKYTRILRLVVIVLLVIFAIIMVVFGRKYLSSNNFEFFAKNLSVEPFVTKENYQNINYDAYYGVKYYGYDNKVVIKNQNELYVFSPTSSLMNRIKIDEKSNVNTDGKYICVYDNTRCSIYNSFTKVMDLSAPLGENITSVRSDMSNYISFITQGGAYASSVKLYMNNFGLIYEWKSNDKYALKTSINPNSKHMAILSRKTDLSNDSTFVTIVNINSGEVQYQNIYKDEKPIDIKYVGENLVVVTDKNIHILSVKMKYSESYINFDEKIEKCFLFSNSFCTVSTNAQGNKIVKIYTYKGQTLGYCEYNYYIENICFAGGNYYISTSNSEVYRQNKSNVKLIYSNEIDSIFEINEVVYYTNSKGCYILSN